MAKVTTQLKTLQADALALFVKLHNYHWNIKGMQFSPIHNMTEGIYESMAGLYDDCAERVLQLGQKPHITFGDITGATRIKEETKSDFDAKYVLESILADYKTLLKAFVELSDAADKEGDKATVGFADEKIASLEKDIWMIKATLS
ncbi:MAG: DNA starvation/stationary phase protection protein [Sulfuricurvum sp.]